MGTRYAQVKLKIPEGFSILLEKFAREVLREQPPDIVTFAANYFRQLLSKRNGNFFKYLIMIYYLLNFGKLSGLCCLYQPY